MCVQVPKGWQRRQEQAATGPSSVRTPSTVVRTSVALVQPQAAGHRRPVAQVPTEGVQRRCCSVRVAPTGTSATAATATATGTADQSIGQPVVRHRVQVRFQHTSIKSKTVPRISKYLARICEYGFTVCKSIPGPRRAFKVIYLTLQSCPTEYRPNLFLARVCKFGPEICQPISLTGRAFKVLFKVLFKVFQEISSSWSKDWFENFGIDLLCYYEDCFMIGRDSVRQLCRAKYKTLIACPGQGTKLRDWTQISPYSKEEVQCRN